MVRRSSPWTGEEIGEWVDFPLSVEGTVVCLGSGSGLFALEAARASGRRVVGVDCRAGAKEALRERCRGYPVKGVVAPAERTGLRSGSAALVLAIRLLHHVDSVQRVLEEIERLLAVGGVVVVGHSGAGILDLGGAKRIEWITLDKRPRRWGWKGVRKE
ncbi:class I SAM-dependent methyltransferase [bacterium]|nr:class I SAM-dependent methyltransferase [bacterium]